MPINLPQKASQAMSKKGRKPSQSLGDTAFSDMSETQIRAIRRTAAALSMDKPKGGSPFGSKQGKVANATQEGVSLINQDIVNMITGTLTDDLGMSRDDVMKMLGDRVLRERRKLLEMDEEGLIEQYLLQAPRKSAEFGGKKAMEV